MKVVKWQAFAHSPTRWKIINDDGGCFLILADEQLARQIAESGEMLALLEENAILLQRFADSVSIPADAATEAANQASKTRMRCRSVKGELL